MEKKIYIFLKRWRKGTPASRGGSPWRGAGLAAGAPGTAEDALSPGWGTAPSRMRAARAARRLRLASEAVHHRQSWGSWKKQQEALAGWFVGVFSFFFFF